MYIEQIFIHQSPHPCYSKPASIAPGSFKTAGGGGCATGAAGGACVGGRDAVGILTNCSLMNSFSLHMLRSETCNLLSLG